LIYWDIYVRNRVCPPRLDEPAGQQLGSNPA